MKAFFPALALAFAAAVAVPLRAQATAADTAAMDSATAAARARLQRGFRAAMIAHGIAHPDALLLLSRNQAGGTRVQVLEGVVPAAVQAVLDTMVQSFPWQRGARPHALLRPEEYTEPGSASDEVPPDVRNNAQLSRVLSRFLSGHPEVGVPGQRFNGALSLVLTRNGTIPYAQVERSTGNVRLDEGIMSAVKRIRIRPGTSGGKPVDTWILLPVQFEILPEAPPPTDDAPRPE